MSRPAGLDVRAIQIFEDGPGIWVEDIFGFVRKRQYNEDLPGYETTVSYSARERDVVSWFWLDDIGVIDRPGQYIRTEQEKLRGLKMLRDYVRTVARELQEIK